MNDSTLTPEMAEHIANEIARLLGELAKVNAQPFQQAEVLTGICTQLSAYYALLGTFISAKHSEHLLALVSQTDALVVESSRLTILTRQLKRLTIALVAFAGIDFIRFAYDALRSLCAA
jgi:hypothetical protein